ncbi:ring-1,2-phenylacetyl-CoA epoxidase subunit PaaE [Mucilaginibacter frigoritolerans]|jgi:ring-1,2-phenylacetyl-CoA epoxidase subunit PaaE|uniref:Ring-1,2-phenylacetyl-CoA epoxidase subunit PaaE n=1 Tax=Mucilaginibacter frigoritolerans TaxID=652788 RepID=A0A562TJW4_9SPHI|nr:iron-sulfur cluster-binding domain-containing protein [Mucilaginibacter frigoritolerans]TWI93805.1 ring-1,2-phenylacetyl-CoA epoxidase subunit PaaE [Mucilaginibacter frigoritolerans]
MKLYTLKVTDIRQETQDSVTILFKQPGLKRIKYIAGQYLSLIFRINGRRYVRPYSFSSAPGVDETLNITVKRVPAGIVSNHIFDKLKIEDVLEVIEPMGDFVLPANTQTSDKHIYLWGAGSGITPLISIAKDALYGNKATSITLAYGNRDYENIIFSTVIEDLNKRFAGIFFPYHFITKPFVDIDNPNVVQGRITEKEIRDLLNGSQGNLKNTIHFICGPVGLKESIKSTLNELGVENSNIFSEDFEVIRNPKDFEDIITQNVLIKRGGESKTVEVTFGKSILEAGLDALMELSYSCQTGNCLVCKARIIKGDVRMIGVEKLPELLESDECLLCSSFPVSDNVEISIEY